MYNDNKWIWKNIYVRDSRDMSFDAFPGEHCFIIGHHVKSKSVIKEATDNLVNAGFSYFNIFGQQANLWAEAILIKAKEKRQSIHLEQSKVDMIRMTYNLAMLATLKEESINLIISDDEYFTSYLLEDLYDIFSGKSEFTPLNWQKFRAGYEFNYCGKDAIISISKDILIGFLGEEKIFENINEAFREKLFEGKNFYEIWNDILQF
ncbi:hypothetical protein [Peptoniphilus sp. Marseille-Q6390]